jgi:hypothetical protein
MLCFGERCDRSTALGDVTGLLPKNPRQITYLEVATFFGVFNRNLRIVELQSTVSHTGKSTDADSSSSIMIRANTDGRFSTLHYHDS